MGRFLEHVDTVLKEIRESGLYKEERLLTGPQSAHVAVSTGRSVLNLCANNYLGLSDHPEVVAAARQGLTDWGNGLASVRFICGTQTIHRDLEMATAKFLHTDDSILYSSCFDANTGLFETLLTAEDAVISDQLNHASIIDGIRLCKAKCLRYQNSDMADLERALKDAQDSRFRLIATDGVFSMDGVIANVHKICDLAKKYDAMVMVDESHAIGVIGKTGRGTTEYRDCLGRVDIITGTFGKALGGASGGFTTGRGKIIELLRQRSRPYLFSNSVAPGVVTAATKALELLSASSEWIETLAANTLYFREAMSKAGFDIPKSDHPIVPVMLGDANLAQKMSSRLLDKGIYVVGFFYPVVPKGQARIRVQISAAHTREDLASAVSAFTEVRDQLQQGG